MAYIIDKQIFYINSRNRVEGTSSSFSHLVDVDPLKEYSHVVLLSCSIPKSFYLVRENQNTFTLTENTQSVVIPIDPGSYNRKSLQLKIQSKLNQLSPNGYTYSVSYQNVNSSQDDGKYYYAVTNNATVQPIFTFGEYLYEQFGFEKNSTNQFVLDAINSLNVVNMNIESTLFIKSNICISEGNGVLQDIISVQDPNFSYIVFNSQNIEEYSKPFVKNKSNIYHFDLTDEDGLKVSLNGLNMNMTLMIYKKDRTNDLIQKYIKYKTFNEKNNS